MMDLYYYHKNKKQEHWIELIGISGLFLCAFGIFFKKSIAHAGFVIMSLSLFLLLTFFKKELRYDRFFLFCIVFLIYIISRSLFANYSLGGYIYAILDGAMKFLVIGFPGVFVFSFWLHRSRENWDFIIFLLILGYILQIFRQIDWPNFSDYMLLLLKGKERATFGFSTNRFGLFSAIILLSCIIFHHNLFGLTKKIGYAIAVFFWGFVTLVCFSGVILSQSRSAWAAVLIVMPVIFFIKKREKGIFKRINIKSSSFVLIALFLFFYLINGPSIVDERLLRIGNYASGFLSRLRLYDYALEQLKLNIWFGHGPGTSEILINSAGNQLVEEKGADHFHNIFLDTIVQLGVVGLIFYLIMFFIIFQNLKTARKYSLIREDFLLFSFGSLSLIFISGIFNQPLHSPHGTYLFALLVGVCCSYKFSIKSPV